MIRVVEFSQLRGESHFGFGWLLCWLLLSAIVPITLNAQVWRNDLLLKSIEPGLSSEAVALDRDGNPHVMLGGDNLYYIWSDGRTWSVDVLFTEKKPIEYACIGFDREGCVHTIFIDVSTGELVHGYQMESEWLFETVCDSVASVLSPIRFDALGNLHTVFIDRHLYNRDRTFASRINGTWSFTPVEEWVDSMETAFDLDPEGKPHLCFQKSDTLKHVYLKGSLWVEEDVTGYRAYRLGMSIDAQGGIHLTFLTDTSTGRHLMYASRTADAWTTFTLENNTDNNIPCIILDSSGRPHLLQYSNGTTISHYYTSGQLWIKENIELDHAFRPVISGSMNSSDRLVIVGYDITLRSVVCMSQGESGWNPEKILDRCGRVGNIVSVIDNRNELHTVFTILDGMQLQYGYLHQGEWTIEAMDDHPDTNYYSQCALGADQSGRIHCIYYNHATSQLLHAEKTGSGWTRETVLEGEPVWSSSMAVDKSGDLAILISNGNELKMARKQSGTWAIQTIGSEGDYGAVSVSMDPDGNPHGAFFRTRTVSGKIQQTLYHIFASQGAWVTELVTELNLGTGRENMMLRIGSDGVLQIGFDLTYRGTHSNYAGSAYSTKSEQGWQTSIFHGTKGQNLFFCLTLDDDPFFVFPGIECFYQLYTGEWIRTYVLPEYDHDTHNHSLTIDSFGRLDLMHAITGELYHSYQNLPAAGVCLEMPGTEFTRNDECFLTAYLRSDSEPLLNAPFCLLLEYQQNYWFWPHWWTTFCACYVDVWPRGNVLPIIPSFNWPGLFWSVGSAEGLVFWAALLNEDMTEIIGGADGLGRWEFSYY